MKRLFPTSSTSNLRVFLASLLSFVIIMMPIASVAAATRDNVTVASTSTEAKSQHVSSGAEDTENRLFVNQPAAVANQPFSWSSFLAIPAPPAGSVTASMVGAITTDVDNDHAADPGVDTITYTATITNNTGADVSNILFNDTVDTHTTLVAGSAVAVTSDSYSTIGNVNISILANQGVLANDFNPDTGNNTGMSVFSYGATTGLEQTTVGQPTATAQGGTVTVNSDGSFTYDPATGFTGSTDTFKYSANSAKTAIATVTITITGRIWFINNSGGCLSNCDGRLSHPFTSLANFQAINDNAVALTHAKTGDSIFIYESGIGYTGPVTLLNNQKLIGQDATATLETITGLSTPSGSTVLPAMNSANGTIATINSSASNGINLGQGNTIRGLTISGTTGAKISGSSFGTLTVGNSTSPDVSLSGTGQALSLTTGTLASTSGFSSVASTSSTSTGITLDNVSVASGGTISFGSTSTSSSTAEGILVKDCTTANSCSGTIGFGNTTVTNGTDGVSFTNNNAGTRTFGTLGVSGGSGSAFKHATGGGNVTVTGAATLSSAGSAVNVSAPGGSDSINFQAATSATSTGSGNAGVNWAGVSGATITFSALTIQTNAGTGLNASGGGTVTVTNATGTINNTTQTAPAIVASGVALNANFASIKSSGGTNSVSLTNVTGTSDFGGGALSGATGATFLVSGGTATVTYSGNVTQATASQLVVSISGGHNTGTITFQTGTVSASNGTGLQFDNANGTYNFNGTNTLNGGNAHVQITNGSSGTFTFSSNTTITNPSSSPAFDVSGGSTSAPNVTYSGTLTQNTASQRAINISAITGGTESFSSTITSDGGAGVSIEGTGGTVNISGNMTLNNTASVFKACSGTCAAPSGTGLHITATGSSNTIGATNAATTTGLTINGAQINSAGVSFKSISVNGATNGILLNNTGTTAGTNGGLTVTGTSTTAGSGGTIQNTVQGALFTSTINLSLSNMNFTNPDSGNGTVNNVDNSTFNSAAQAGINMSSVTTATFTNLNVNGNGGSGGAQVGINGQNVSGLSIINSTVNGFGDAAQEGDVKLWDLTGTCAVTNSTFSFVTGDSTGGENLFEVRNDTGTLTLTVTGSTFQNTRDSANGSGGIAVTSTSGATVNLNVYHNSFLNLKTSGIEGFAKMTSTMTANVTDGGTNGQGNIFDPQNTAVPGGGRAIEFSSQDSAHQNFNINRNAKIWGSNGPIVNIYAQDNANIQGRIDNNPDIRNNSTATSPVGSPVFIHPQDNATGIVEVSGNTIIGKNDPGIEVSVVGDGISKFNAAVDANITSNNITMSGANTFGILLSSGASNSDATNVYANVQNNAVTLNGSGNLAFGIENTGGSSAHVYLEGFTTDGQTTWNNRGNTPTNSYAELINVNEPAAIPAGHNGGNVQLPSNTNALLINPMGNRSNEQLAQAGNTPQNDVNSLLVFLNIRTDFTSTFDGINGATEPVSTNNARPSQLVAGAESASEKNTSNTAWLAQMNATVGIASVESNSTHEQQTAIANTAEGRVWSDIAPASGSEARTSKTAIDKSDTNQAPGYEARIVKTSYQPVANETDSASSRISVPTSDTRSDHARSRRVSAASHSANASTLNAAPVGGCSPSGINNAGTAICVDIPTLHNGDSIQISFQVKVNNLPNLDAPDLSGGPHVSNSATVTGAATGLPTTTSAVNTPVDLFNTTTTLSSDNNPSNGGDAVTFTATVAFDTNTTPAPNPSNTVPTGTVQFKDGATPITCTNGNTTTETLDGTGKATCTTSSLSAGGPAHSITAVYSGDGNFDPSTSNTVSQTVNACVMNPIVTTTVDDVNNTASLRYAVANVCSAPNNNITFNLTAGPHTITLGSELVVGKNVNITNVVSAGNGALTISGNNTSRVFNINSGKTVNINNLKITGGSLSSGGNGAGILNNGTLTLLNSTVSGNQITGGAGTNAGAGIANIGSGSSLTIANSTISGNTIGSGTLELGGGIYVSGTVSIINSTIANNLTNGAGSTNEGAGIFAEGTLNLANVTISGNSAVNGSTNTGGGIYINGGTANAINSIISLNTATTSPDISGSLGVSTNNLIGTSAGQLQLGSLGNNGGPTQTMALAPSSVAIDGGTNVTTLNGAIDNVTTSVIVTDGTNIPAGIGFLIQIDNEQMSVTSKAGNTLTVVRGANATTAAPHNDLAPVNPAFDQRGANFPRKADSADADTIQTVDIGAYEAHPTVEDITDKSTAEDTTLNVTFNIGDGTGALIQSVAGTSSNQTLIPDANITVDGSGSTRTIHIKPATDANTPHDGTATITVTVTATNGQTATDTFVLTVTEVNDLPVANNDTVTDINEDSGVYSIPFSSLTGNDSAGPANESGQTLTITQVGNATGGTVQINGTNVEFTPTADYNGAAGFDYTITDNGTTNGSPDPKTASAHVSFNINAVNDAPTVSAPASYTGTPNVAVSINGITVGDVDSQGGTELMTFSVPSGTLAAASSGGVIIGGSATNLTATGTISDLNAYFGNGTNNLTFTGTASTTTLTININDQGHTGTGGALSANASPSPQIILCQSPAIVTNTSDSGAGSLRQAITDVCPGGTITFQIPTGDGGHDAVNHLYTIMLTGGELAINNNLTIQGPNTGADTDAIVISGNNASRVFNISSGTVVLNSLTIANGKVSGGGNNFGGGIYNNGTLTITNSTLSGNQISSGINLGGGIYNTGTVTITNSTVSGNSASDSGSGSGNQGGGIYNTGTVTITNSTVSGNSASGGGGGNFGGGIFNVGTLTITNITVSGNSASGNVASGNRGGGIYNDGPLTITNSTVSGNSASGGGGNFGGGIYLVSGTVNTKNTIIAGNTASTNDPDVFGTINSQGYNIIGDTTGATITQQTGDQFGVTAAQLKLDTLKNNGGPTQTMALLAGSVAIDAGTDVTTLTADITTTTSPTTINVAGATAFPAGVGFVIQIDSEQMIVTSKTSTTLTVTRGANGTTAATHNNGAGVNPAFDQRGTPFQRKQAGTANATATVDIGAFEVQPPTAVDDSYSTNEDTPLVVSDPANGVLANDTGVGTKTASVATGPAHALSFNLNTDGSFDYTPAQDYNGQDTFTYTVTDSGGGSAQATVTITINAVNDAPVAVNDSYSTNEDTALNINAASGVLSNDTDVDTPHSSLTAILDSGPANASLFTLNSDGSFNYTPNSNFNGQDTFTYHANDGSLNSNTATVTITVNSVNDAPTTSNNAVTTLEDTAYTFQTADFPFSDTADNPNANTLLNVIVTSLPASGTLKYNGTAISSVPTSVSATDIAAGKLTFAPAADANGTPYTTFQFKVQDNGGTNSGGQDTSLTATMTVNVTAVNDAPSFTKGADQTVNEDAGAQTVTNWATAISAGPADENGQTLTFHVTNNTNTALFSTQPAVSSAGTLTYTPAANANGTATITLTLQDSGGTANNGQDTSPTQTFNITVNSVNDVPSFTKGADQTVFANSGAQTVNPWATNISAGPANESGQIVDFIVSNNNNTLFAVQPAVSSTGVLTYTTANNQSGTAIVSVQIHDNGGTASGGQDTSAIQTFNITVNKSNTTTTLSSSPNPSFTGQTVTFTATVTSNTAVTGPPTGTVQFFDGASPLTCANGNTSTQTLDGTGAATCQTSALSAANSPHSITATYNGDGAFNGSTSSPAVQQTVKPVLNLTVNDTGDTPDATLDGVCADSNGKCTLRAAIQETNFAASDDTIGFNLPANSTITLNTALPAINGNLVINGPGANQLTVQRSSTGGTPNFSVFVINSGQTVSISGLTISNGNASIGGGIYNQGTLTLTGCTISGNSVNGTNSIGGGIVNGTTNGTTTLTIANSTISGNSANGGNNSGGGIVNTTGSGTATLIITNSTIGGNSANSSGSFGGGIYNSALGGTAAVTITNSTMSGNSANGGGIYTTGSGTVTVKLSNTIVAGNTRSNGTTPDDINGTVDPTSSFNLIGTGGAGGLTNSVNNNQVGVADARLASLAFNGGTTQTMALLPGSPALDAGSNTLATNAGLTTDQRGTGFNRIVDSSDADSTATVDIGAFEAQPSIDAIPDKTTNEDTALPSFNFGVADGGVSGFTVTATSGNTTLVPNANITLGGAGSTRSLSITPAANQFGTATISVTVSGMVGATPVSMTSTFTLTVNSVNDAPSFTPGGNQTVNEDAGAQSVQWATAISAGPANESGQALNFIVSNNNNALFSTQPAISPTGVLTYTPAPDANGVATVTVALHDDGGTANGGVDTSPQVQFTITVNAVNDPPVNIVPGSQATPRNTSLTFSTANANQIATSDVDAGNNPVQVTLTATNGKLTLATTAGLNFSVGNGSNNTTMTFTGTITNINTALNGMVFSPTPGFDGQASVTITTNDQGFTGSGGPQTDTDTVQITVNKGGVLAFSSSTYSVSEGGGSITITVNRIGGSSGTTKVDFATSNGTATAGADYTATSGTLTFGNGETSKTFSVPILEDQLNEANETINLSLSNVQGSGDIGAPSTAVITIQDNDPQPSLSINDVSKAEGNSGTTDFTFTVTLSAVSGQTVSVNYATADGTATAPSDYQATSGSLTFAPGDTTKTITVKVNGDTTTEPDETFTVNLTSPTNATVSKAAGTGTILNDDAPAMQFSASSYTVGEGDGHAVVTVNRLGDSSQAASINYATSDQSGLNNCSQITGFASQRCDYAITVGKLNFAAGESSKSIFIPIVDDAYTEGPEVFTLSLSNPTGGVIQGASSVTITITDNDAVNGANPLDQDAFFVRQLYIDFLDREPDPPGLQGWLNVLHGVNSPQCVLPTDCDRIAVALGFVNSPEFTDRGYFIYRLYKTLPDPTNSTFGRIPHYFEFVADMAKVSGFLSTQDLNAAKDAFIAEFMSRAEFANKYGATLNDPAGYVDALLATVNLPSHPSRDTWVTGLTNGTLTRGQVLRQLVESAEVTARFKNEAFVIMNYFGFLRRDADAAFTVWIQIFNNTNDQRLITNGFLNSPEFRLRFAP